MDDVDPKQSEDKEIRMQAAIQDFQDRKYKSSRDAARAYNISDSTLRNRMAGRTTRVNSHGLQQILSNAEEKTLVRWITRLTCAGFPASPSLMIQMTEEVRRERAHLRNDAITSDQSIRPIDHNWLYRFESRHPELARV